LDQIGADNQPSDKVQCEGLTMHANGHSDSEQTRQAPVENGGLALCSGGGSGGHGAEHGNIGRALCPRCVRGSMFSSCQTGARGTSLNHMDDQPFGVYPDQPASAVGIKAAATAAGTWAEGVTWRAAVLDGKATSDELLTSAREGASGGRPVHRGTARDARSEEDETDKVERRATYVQVPCGASAERALSPSTPRREPHLTRVRLWGSGFTSWLSLKGFGGRGARPASLLASASRGGEVVSECGPGSSALAEGWKRERERDRARARPPCVSLGTQRVCCIHN
jgi:dihydroxyacetone kinase